MRGARDCHQFLADQGDLGLLGQHKVALQPRSTIDQRREPRTVPSLQDLSDQGFIFEKQGPGR